MSSWAELLQRAQPRQHVVHLYGSDDQLLTRHVSRFLEQGLRSGDGLLVIATADHRTALERQLRQDGGDPDTAAEAGRLVMLDAATTLERLMRDGEPDQELFDHLIGGVIRQIRAAGGQGTIRAFGEMVGVLWDAGRHAAAIRLETHWNRLLETHAVSLFCAYPIDAFDGTVEAARLSEILGAHHHLLAGSRTLLSSSAS